MRKKVSLKFLKKGSVTGVFQGFNDNFSEQLFCRKLWKAASVVYKMLIRGRAHIQEELAKFNSSEKFLVTWS